ncbi:GRIP-related ARF-binding domain-containing protein 1 [Arabidopsis thaliana]|uniref:GRIP-related ARF-binding domain-containing protein 1 n=1 Tax=Arabidopsis thaliana TaxID=3702 RepID=A0A1I9LRB9_ARATH|nr:GRIP-related ARF-binding domain-containing protein 1 [Arabidopsis thaliana]ANM65127.1 GRIP-related ARF-binding domain-containing protein 1 [Arabidopsis thaliana]|eukprot:NP_001327121.1 GRIP-related ARF-binding domain-containing protein 1 [Arabidopsis thaliana]
MWSSIENMKANLHKIVLDVHEDDEEEDDLHKYGSANGVSNSDRRNSSGFRSVSRYSISNGIESPAHHEIERYKAEIKKLQESESDIKALSVNYAALLREKEDQISRLNQENGSLKQNLTSTSAALKEARTDISRGSNNYAIKGNNDQSPNRLHKSVSHLKSPNHMSNGKGKDTDSFIKEKDLADMLEDRTKSMAAVQATELAKEREKLRDFQLSLQEERKRSESFKEELESMRLDKNKTSMEISKMRSELDAKLLEIKHLQMKLTGQESHAIGPGMEHLKEVNKALEKENNELKLKRSELEAALEESRKLTNSKVFPDATESLTRHPSTLDKEKPESFPGKEEMEQSLQRLEMDLKETQRERDKARQELKRLKQHLLEKETEESEKMDEDSRLIEELRQTNEYQRSQISHLEKSLKQAISNQEDNRLSNDNQIRKLKDTVDDLNQKLTNCLRTIESKNVELLNLQTALGQYYAEIEAKEHFERELAMAKDELMKLSARLKDSDERLESSNKEKEDVTSKLLHAEKVAAEWKNRVTKVEEDNAKVRRVLEQSMTRLNRMSMESDYLVDRRIVIKLLVTYFQKNHNKEVLDLMVRMLGFSEEDKERIGAAKQGGGKGVVRGVLGFPGRFVGGILGGKSAELHANAASDNQVKVLHNIIKYTDTQASFVFFCRLHRQVSH